MVWMPKFGRLVRRAVAAGGGSPVENEAPAPSPEAPAEPPYSEISLQELMTPVPGGDAGSVVIRYDPGIEIPSDWRDLPWPKLRSLAASLSTADAPVINKADAVARIEAEIERRS